MAKDEHDDETAKERYGRVHCSLKNHYQITNKSPRNHCRIKNVNVNVLKGTNHGAENYDSLIMIMDARRRL